MVDIINAVRAFLIDDNDDVPLVKLISVTNNTYY